MKFYKAWLVKDRLLIPDPEETTARYHTSIFIETRLTTNETNGYDTATDGHQGDKNNTENKDEIHGWIHEVTGDISTSTGMAYIRRPAPHAPESSETFHTKEFLGFILASEYPDNVDRVCRAVPPPHCQKKFNTVTMRYEGFKPDGSFYAVGERAGMGPGYFKCTEWTEEKVVPMLYREEHLRATI